jgi:hypothetical protein
MRGRIFAWPLFFCPNEFSKEKYMTEGTGEGINTGDGTGQKPAWVAQLPSDLKDNEAFTQYKTIGDLAKAHLEVSGKVKDLDGMKAKLDNSIPKLAADAKPEDREAYFKALGRPDKADGYEFDGDNLDEKATAYWKNAFFEAGVPKDQGKALSSKYNAFIKGLVDGYKAQAEADEKQATEKLKTELGDQFEPTKELAARLWNKHFSKDPEAIKFLTTPTREGMLLGNNPYLIRLLAKLGKVTGEDTSPRGSPGAGSKPNIRDNPEAMFPNTKF